MEDKKTVFVLSCPFCGRKPSFFKEFLWSWTGPVFIASCTRCQVRKSADTLDKCVKAWNRRYSGSKQGYAHTFSKGFNV